MFAQTAIAPADRYLTVPCDGDGCHDLAVIWDRLEEQVVDVIQLAGRPAYSEEDQLWDEARAARNPVSVDGISNRPDWIPALAA